MTERHTGPEIEDLEFVSHLGTGGYSDVYLYERQRPRMQVAVKVLTDSRLDQIELDRFAAEAETMAALADHPYIVQVFSTGLTDDGRPYLVMKYYPPPNLGEKSAQERFSVASVLRIGIKICSAVETAHQAGILHRDIKPANILVSRHDEPGLADFGIAGTVTEAESEDDLGVSIPWSPPEVLSGKSNGSVESDVYSLAATFWHLLVGRSPFEVPGGDNSPRALVGRILTKAPPPIGRAEVPASLDRLVQQAMAKNPKQRPGSALELARLLQGVEQELRYQRTEIVVDAEQAARVRLDRSPAPAHRYESPSGPRPTSQSGSPATTVRPHRPSGPARSPSAPATTVRPASPGPPPRPADPPPSGERDRRTSGVVGEPSATIRRPARATAPPDEASDPPPRRGVRPKVALLAVAVVVVAAVTAGVVLVSGGGSGSQTADPPPKSPVGDDQGGFGASTVNPPEVRATYDAIAKKVRFIWAPADGSGATPRYVYSIGSGAPVGPTTITSVEVPATDPSATCITVALVTSDGVHHLAAPVCGA